MEDGLELDNDVFFKELSKQIILLIMDDDDDGDSLARCPSVNSQGFTQAIYTARQEQEQEPEPEQEQESVIKFYEHQQITRSKTESKGTGVFIPLPFHPGKKNIKRRRKSIASLKKPQRPCTA